MRRLPPNQPTPARDGRLHRDAPPREALEVHEAVKQINALWLSGRVARLNEFLLADVVMVAPMFEARLEGLRAVIESFQAFIRNARVHGFRESEFQVDVWEDSAMATYRFDMTYDFGGATYEEAGRELWLFVRVDKRWRLAWRHQVPLSRRTISTG